MTTEYKMVIFRRNFSSLTFLLSKITGRKESMMAKNTKPDMVAQVSAVE